jgi:hypothetical protein
MELNLSAEIRKVVYTVTAVGTPTMVYLNQQGVVNDFWLGLFSVVVGAVAVLARVNVSNQ